jgi:hypothetical protein
MWEKISCLKSDVRKEDWESNSSTPVQTALNSMARSKERLSVYLDKLEQI